MHPTLTSAFEFLLNRQDLPVEVTCECVGAIMDGGCDAVEMAAFLTAMAVKGPAASELVGAAQAMRQRAARVPSERRGLVDTCGTGGDRLHTFNISTAAAIVTAACGVPVAKHGNRSVSSSSGSADVLETLGVNLSLSPAAAGRCLDAIGLTFCFAPGIHGAMKYAAPVRRQLGFPTIFNLLGPLTNPAAAAYQVIGTGSNSRAGLLADAVAQLPIQRAFVVCGNNELDEVALWGTTTVFDVSADRMSRQTWTAATFGLPECRVHDLQVRSAAESAAVIRSVFAGERSCRRDMVVANAAAALLVSGHCETPLDAAEAAASAIDDGRASCLLNQLIEWTRQCVDTNPG